MKKVLNTLRRHFPLESLLNAAETETSAAPLRFNEYKLSGAKRLVLRLLWLSPWLCGLGMLAGLLLPAVLPAEMLAGSYGLGPLNWSLGDMVLFVKTISVGGLIGYGTNYIAIKMLFRPVKRRPIWGQGLIPAQRDTIVHAIARGIDKYILNPQLLRKRIEESGVVERLNSLLIDGTSNLLQDKQLHDEIRQFLYHHLSAYFQQPRVREHLYALIDEKVEQKADKGIKKFALSAYKRFNREDYDILVDKLIADIPTGILEVVQRAEAEVDAAVTYIQAQRRASSLYLLRFVTGLLHKLDIHGFLTGQMAHFDEERLEKLIREATNEQLLYIQYLGAVLGMLGALVIWRDYMALVFLALFGVLWLVDEFLYRLRGE